MRAKTIVILTMLLIVSSQMGVSSQTGQRTTRSKAVGEIKRDMVEYAESHALVIGVSDYANWRKLPGVAEDIPAVGALFKRLGFAVETPKVENREDFNRELDLFISRYGRNVNNRLMIYFAGHGYTENRADGVQVGYVVMKDAPLNPTEAGFDLSLVSMDELNARAIRIGAKHVMFIFDSCFAGTIFSRSTGNNGGGKVPALIMEKAALPVRQFITSGTAMQEVPDRSDFRLLLERAFDDRGADFYPKDGYVTGEELGRYLAGQVASVSRGTQTPEYGKIKEVRLQRGDMVFRLPEMKEEEKVAVTNRDGCDLAWREVEKSQNEAELVEYLKECEGAPEAKAARIRLIRIREANRVRKTESNETVAIPVKPVAERSIYRSMSYKTGEVSGGAVTIREAECEVNTEELGNGVKLEMVKVPGGEFLMGSPEKEQGRGSDEGPVRRVTVREFLMGRYEVTQKIWRAVAALPKIGMELNPDPSRFKGDELPVETVSWDEVKEFLARLNRKLGLEESKGYRLPSEAEWEYAARGGTTTPFGFGETIGTNMVNYDGNYPYGGGEKGEYRAKTVGVGSLGLANRFGLYEMHGNVWEWCEDQYRNNYNGAPVDGTAWRGLEMAAGRVFRGGSWFNDAVYCRSANRDRNEPGDRYDSLGFRLSRTLP